MDLSPCIALQPSCSYAKARPIRRQAAVLVAAVKRQWGSNWGKKRDKQSPSITSATNSGLSLRSACNQLAQAVQQEFLQRDIKGSCIPASAVFYEAVTAIGAADVQLDLCYMRAFNNTYVRHMRVVVDGERFDIGGDIARAALSAEGLPAFTLTTEDTLPAGAKFLGWGASLEPMDNNAVQVSAQAEAGMLQQLRSAQGRELYWSGSPPHLLEAREKILALSSALKDTMRTI